MRMSECVGECQRPIIIRKKKIYKADGHHGGAWKVAYADFVTAMMAFFLLMWLLNATTEEQRKGISDYFNPNIPLAAVSGGGADALNGDSIFTEETQARNGTGADNKRTTAKAAVSEAGKKTDTSDFEDLAAMAKAMGEDNREISKHLQVKMSPEGLVIELIDADNEPLFSVGKSEPSPLMRDLIEIIATVFRDVKNNIKIVGHTDARASDEYNMALSDRRADAVADIARAAGVRVVDVKGFGERQPRASGNSPEALQQNRRVEIYCVR